MSKNKIAEEIANQIGAVALHMIGAKHLVAGSHDLTFSIGRNAKNVNKVRVSLNGADLYNVSFYSIRGINVHEVAHLEDVYASDLRDVIEKKTGMYTSL